MTIELWMLLASVGMLMAGIVFQGVTGLVAFGALRQAGARDEARDNPKLVGRGARAVQNQLESLAMFTPVVLIAHVTDTHTVTTVMGAQLYALARVAYMPSYWLGIPFIRTMLFTAGLVGTVMVAWPLLTG